MRSAVFSFVLILFASVTNAAEPRPPRDGSNLTCPDPAVLARELLEMELAGVRVASRTKPSCLAQDRYAFVRILRPDFGEVEGVAELLDADEDAPFQLGEIRRGAQGTVAIDFTWRVKQASGVREIRDTISISLYEGYAKRFFGCASMLIPPQNVVLRRSCRL